MSARGCLLLKRTPSRFLQGSCGHLKPGADGNVNKPNLSSDFANIFGGQAEWLIRAPGRVNLIGDHTDYNNLPVFPMAIQRSVTIVGRTRADDLVRVANVDSAFGGVEFKLDGKIIPGVAGAWGNYVRAGAGALTEDRGVHVGFDALVSSDIPVAAGLSSSSALVVASGLAACCANSLSLPVATMAELMTRAERFVGTQGGGMDQAVCLGGKEGAALRIDFAPLRVQRVNVPVRWRFIVAHSLVRAEKAAAVQDEYNQRVNDCRLGLTRVSHSLRGADAPTVCDYPTALAAYGAEALLRTAKRELSVGLFSRFRHTVTEANRVESATQAMREGDRTRFGKLMIASHTSLRDDFAVSVPALDNLVDIMIAAGCDGARLTGAGFGGCVVGLCRSEWVDHVRESIISEFYGKRGVSSGLGDLVFVAEPSDGAAEGRKTVGR